MTKTAAFAIAEILDTREQVINVRLPPELFIVLTQVRRTYQVDEDLIQSFLAEGQMVPGMVAALNPTEAKIYVDSFNDVFSSDHRLEDLSTVRLDGKPYYLIIFAGHRRHRTCLAVNRGIESGEYGHTTAFDGDYRAELHFAITAEQALGFQFNENRYTPPPIHEEADAAWRFYRHKRSQNPSLTPGQFARLIGRTPDWFRNAVRFCSLPMSVQSYVLGDNPTGAKLSYGVLVELARLAEGWQALMNEPLSEVAMHRWIKEAVASRLNATLFGRKVTEYLDEVRREQAGQFSLFDLNESDKAHTERIRRTVAREMVPGIWKVLQYLRTVENFRQAGMLGHESYMRPAHSPEEMELYSPGSPIRLLAESADVMQLLMPHLAELARLERTGHARRFKRLHPELANIAELLKGFQQYEQAVAIQ